MLSPFLFASSILLDYFFSVVRAASLAYAMCEHVLTALCALYHTGHLELRVVGTSLISASAGNLFLRNCHFIYTSLGYFKHIALYYSTYFFVCQPIF